MAKPTIRFKGYTEDWEQRKVTELLKNSSSAMKIGPFGSALKKEYFVDEGIKVYAQENAFTGDFSIGDYYITEDKYKELQSCELYPGDLVISMMGTIGACAIFPENAEKGIMNSHLLRLQFDNEVIPKYIMYLLRDSDLIRKQIDRLSVGSIMSGLSSSVVKKLVFPIPTLAEQKRIVEYLDSLNNLITLHQRKCEETKILKKYMLQKMFPQNGQKVPEIRFKGFTEDWEQRKSGELVKEGILEAPLDGNHGEKHPTSDEYVDSGIPFLMASDIHDGEVNIYSCKYITKERAERLDKGFARNGDVLLTHKATIGETAILSNLMTEYAMLTPQVTYYRIKNEERLNREYLYSFFNSLDFQTELKTKAAQSTRPYIGITAQQNLKIILPAEIDEQRKIGLYFRNLDYLITLHQRKYEELKNIKKFMLQNMFV